MKLGSVTEGCTSRRRLPLVFARRKTGGSNLSSRKEPQLVSAPSLALKIPISQIGLSQPALQVLTIDEGEVSVHVLSSDLCEVC